MAGSPIRDPGLQAERTSLAWSRTAASLLLNALLALRAGYIGGSAFVVVLALAMVLTAVGTFLYARHRRRTLLGSALDIDVPTAAVVAISVAVLAAAVTGLSAVWVRHAAM